MSEYRRVISGSHSHLEDCVAFMQSKRIDPACVRAGLTDIDSPPGVQSDERVLIDKREIVILRFDVSYPWNID